MKLDHYRWFGAKLFNSCAHYSFQDSMADKLAAAIRKELGCSARVVQTQSPGVRHVFVPQAQLDAAMQIASRGEFN